MPEILNRLLCWFVLLPVATIAAVNNAQAQEVKKLPWEKYSLSLGYFVSTLDSSIRLGSGLGLDIDLEDTLNMDSELQVFRADGMWRTGRHRLTIGWFAFHRSASRTLLEDIVIKNPDDEEIVIAAGTTVESFLDLDMAKLTYSYSFLQDDRIDLGVNAGLFIAPISTGISSRGLVNESGSSSFTAPLPLLGLRMDIALAPKWYTLFLAEAFYLQYDNYRGSIYQTTLALEYRAWQHVAFGAGIDTMTLKIQADDDSLLGVEINFKGNIGFQYTGLMFYLKAIF